jgi:hypothetical protein
LGDRTSNDCPHGEPKSTQHTYRNTCRGGFSTTYMTPVGKTLKEQYQWEATAQ